YVAARFFVFTKVFIEDSAQRGSANLTRRTLHVPLDISSKSYSRHWELLSLALPFVFEYCDPSWNARRGACAVHTGRIEAPRDVALWRNHDNAARTFQDAQPVLNHLVSGLLHAVILILHECADLSCDGQSNEKLANAGARNSARLIRRVGAGSDDR